MDVEPAKAEETDDNVGSLVRAAVSELESALQDSRQLLAERESELASTRKQLESCRHQMAQEILKKTEISMSLENSRSHALKLEELVEKWQDELQAARAQEEKAKTLLAQEVTRNDTTTELVRQLRAQNDELTADNRRLNEALRLALQRQRERGSSSESVRSSGPAVRLPSSPAGRTTSPDPDVNMMFLKDAVFSYMTDRHPEDQVRAIVAILDFTAKQRKQIYYCLQQKGLKFGKN